MRVTHIGSRSKVPPARAQINALLGNGLKADRFRKRNKFGAVKTVVDGIKFASKAESDRYWTLANMQKAGEITGLSPHPEFSMVVMGKLIGHYTADASYFRKSDRKVVAEDTKSPRTRTSRDYRLRIKLCQAIYPNVLFEEHVAK